MAWTESIQIDPMGEAAFVLRNLGGVSPAFLAHALAESQGILEAAPAYDTVGVYPESEYSVDRLKAALSTINLMVEPECLHHTIPVCYSLGDDLAEVCGQLNLSEAELIAIHGGPEYRCFAVGFQPGFPFLGYLDEAISGLARKPSPRIRVPRGSVGITGRQTGIYPADSPGGWWLIGRTPLCIADLGDGYFPISAGDRIRFMPIDEAEFRRLEGKRL